MRYVIFLINLFFFIGCLYPHSDGVGTRYYDDCKEFYDASGEYHKECGNRIIRY